MSSTRQTVRNLRDIEILEARLTDSAQRTVIALPAILGQGSPLEVLARLKFEETGFHPFEERSLNLVEQLNQTFTYLASLRAARWIWANHPDAFPLHLNLGTASGFDIESADGSVVAETFATVSPSNNRKLARDVEKLARAQHSNRYVFYICPGRIRCDERQVDGVKIVQLNWPEKSG
jgi:hypothetical protein